MGLKITPQPFTKVLCNTVGFLSNKGEKQQAVKLDKNKIAYKNADIGIAILKPSMDRITFGFSPSQAFLDQYDPTESLEAYQKKIHDWLFADAKASDCHLSFVTGVSVRAKCRDAITCRTDRSQD